MNFVSAYATAHPWEDFAETWAHYLHIVDTLGNGPRLRRRMCSRGSMSRRRLKTRIEFDPYRAQNIEPMIEAWLPLTFAFNSINRCMGQADLYPFVLGPGVMEKLGFIHTLVHGATAGQSLACAAG